MTGLWIIGTIAAAGAVAVLWVSYKNYGKHNKQKDNTVIYSSTDAERAAKIKAKRAEFEKVLKSIDNYRKK